MLMAIGSTGCSVSFKALMTASSLPSKFTTYGPAQDALFTINTGGVARWRVLHAMRQSICTRGAKVSAELTNEHQAELDQDDLVGCQLSTDGLGCRRNGSSRARQVHSWPGCKGQLCMVKQGKSAQRIANV